MDSRRRTVAVVESAQIIWRRDVPPYVPFGPPNPDRVQWVLDRKDDRARSCEEELRGLATERGRHRAALRALADELTVAWQEYARIVVDYNMPPGYPFREGVGERALQYIGKYEALGEQIAALRKRLESRLP